MRVAVVQLCAGADPAANWAQASRVVREAAARGAELILLPEKWLAIGPPPVIQAAAGAEWSTLPARLRDLAAELQIDLVAGSVPELPADGDPRPFNSCLHLRPDGAVGATYRKVHLFDADVAGVAYRESAGERAGDAAVLTTLTGGAVAGLSICFDLRFGALYAALAAGGADLLLVPAAFTRATTRAHWEVLLRSRAIEHGCFVLAANQFGTHPDGTQSGGRSMIISPWGKVLAAAREDEATVLTADLDLAEVSRARAALPVAQLQRADVYAAPVRRGGADLATGGLASD